VSERVCGCCGASLEGKRRHAQYCGADCRRAAWAKRRRGSIEKASETLPVDAQRLRDGRIRTIIGPCLTITVPGDWPERSARFWTEVKAIQRQEVRQR
jgi:hypothetical protein